MNIDRKKLEKLFDEHFIYESSNEVFDAMDEIIDYTEKAVKLCTIANVVERSEQLECTYEGCSNVCCNTDKYGLCCDCQEDMKH